MKPKESDWKLFSSLIVELRERYLESKNRKIVEILSNEIRSPTERFWDACEYLDEEKKILESCLDGRARSRMLMQMGLMYRYGMLNDEDLNKFSRELQEQLKPLKQLK